MKTVHLVVQEHPDLRGHLVNPDLPDLLENLDLRGHLGKQVHPVLLGNLEHLVPQDNLEHQGQTELQEVLEVREVLGLEVALVHLVPREQQDRMELQELRGLAE